MSIIDKITLVLAVWGAVISTILIYREFLKDRRSIFVYIDFIEKFNAYQLRILNTYQRPITVIGVEVYLYSHTRWKRYFETKAPLRRYLSHNEDDFEYPTTLGDGDYKIYRLPRNLNEILMDNYLSPSPFWNKKNKRRWGGSGDIEIYVLDVEGKKYLAKEGSQFNPSYDHVIG